jgi:hypothetical protein
MLSKGALATGSVAYTLGEAVMATAGSQLYPFQVARATDNAKVVGIVQETMDASKVLTGKATVGVAITGIMKGIAGGAIAMGAAVRSNASARFVTAGAGSNAAGYALSAAAANGDYFDILLTPSSGALAAGTGGSVTDLTNANGTSDGTLQDVTATFTQTILNNNFRDLSDKVNQILAALRSAGIIT